MEFPRTAKGKELYSEISAHVPEPPSVSLHRLVTRIITNSQCMYTYIYIFKNVPRFSEITVLHTLFFTKGNIYIIEKLSMD